MPKRLAMVRAVAARLGAASTTREAANATLEAANEFLEAVTASVWLVTEDRSALEVRYESNAHPDAMARFAQVPLTATNIPGPHVIATGEPCFLESLEQRDREWPAIAGTPTPSDALVVLPLQVNNVRLGVVSFGFAEPREFDNEDRVALLAIADQCAIALDRARLYEEQRERAESQTLLATISSTVHPSMDWVGLARHAAQVCVAEFAEVCAVYVREGHLVRRVALASRSYPQLAEHLVDHFPTALHSEAPNALAVRTGRAAPVPPVQRFPRQAASPSPTYADLTRDVRTGPGWIFPLMDRGKAFGSMLFLAPENELMSEEAAELARAVAERTANLLLSASAFAEQRAAIAALHDVALPGAAEHIPGLDVVARYVPLGEASTLGGDWWDALALPNGTIGLAVGDVAGHGVPPAAVMGQLRNALRSDLVAGRSPADALQGVGTFLDWTHPSAHCTAIAARLALDARSLEWCNAAHPPPLVVSSDGDATFLDTPPAPPLGVVGRAPYVNHRVTFGSGQTLVLYTDGLIEGRARDIDAGLGALASLAREIRLDEPLEAAADRVLAGMVDHPEDDICMLMVRRAP